MIRTLLAVLISMIAVVQAQSSPAGQWRLQFATPLGVRAVSLTINQHGASLSGHVTDEYGEYPLEGRFNEGVIAVVWSVYDDGKMLELTMTGTLTSDANGITGTVKLGDVGEGPASARRTGDSDR